MAGCAAGEQEAVRRWIEHPGPTPGVGELYTCINVAGGYEGLLSLWEPATVL